MLHHNELFISCGLKATSLKKKIMRTTCVADIQYNYYQQ